MYFFWENKSRELELINCQVIVNKSLMEWVPAVEEVTRLRMSAYTFR